MNWTDVNDRLPSFENGYVLVACRGGKVTTTFFSKNAYGLERMLGAGYYSRKKQGKNSKYFDCAHKFGDKVTHWMPLPKAPTSCPHCQSTFIDLTWVTPSSLPEYQCGHCNECNEVWNECARGGNR